MLILSCLLLSVGMVVAQTKQASGVVLDDTGAEVIGAAIIVKGTSTGTITDADGRFSLNVPAGKDDLVVSYVGMQSQEVKAGQNLKIVLTSTTDLDELVVTAMGITRSEKSLGYNVSKVTGEDLLVARDANMLNSLAGKMAGVTVTSSSGTLGGSSKIIIRGANSLDGKNQPLFVVDGLPIDNGAAGSTSTNVSAGSIDTGNRGNDLNSDDVESISVLKGAAAAALYGARAKNGAIIITTKKGSKNSKLNIDVNSSVRFDKVTKLPEFQNDYAQGNYGVYDNTVRNGWGPKIAGQTEKNFLGQDVALQAHPDNVKDFYETGQSYINSIALSGGNQTTDYRVSFSATNQKGTIPETAFNRYTFGANVGHSFTKKFTSRTYVNYNTTVSDGRASQSSNNSNVLGNAINYTPRTVDMALLKDNWIDETGNQISMTGNKQTDNNPYWILNRNKFKGNLERFILSNSFVYKPMDGLTFTDNIGLDNWTDDRRQVTSKGTFGKAKGMYETRHYNNQSITNDFIATLDRSLTPDLDLKVIAGHNIFQNTYKYDVLTVEELIVDGLYNPSNGATKVPVSYFERNRILGVYADFGLSYKNYLYLNVTGRNDWSSKLPKNNRSYFYPSISSSFVFSELIADRKWLDFGNIRASWASVGSDGDRSYMTAFSYVPQSEYYTQYSLSGAFPNNGLVGFSIPRIYPSLDLEPQRQNTFEVGANLKFLNNRVGIDLTYYNISTKNQILAIDVPLSTGYFAQYMNVGEVSNKGYEIALNLVPVKLRDLTWTLDVNFGSNKQRVENLDENNPDLTYSVASGWSGLQTSAAKGESFGLYGKMWERNENGDIVIDGKTGYRKTVTGRLGDIYPEWTMGINNSFNYKGFSLNFLIDIREGGVMYSGTSSALTAAGLTKETLYGRGGTIVDKGVVLQADGSYVANTKEVDAQDFWQQNYKVEVSEAGVYDASYIKLRELRVGYSLPTSFVKKLSMTRLEIAVEARNIWTIKDHVPHVDPESSMYGVNSAAEGVEFNSVPSTKSFGVNLRIGF